MPIAEKKDRFEVKNRQNTPFSRRTTGRILMEALESRVFLDATLIWSPGDISDHLWATADNWIDASTGQRSQHAPINELGNNYYVKFQATDYVIVDQNINVAEIDVNGGAADINVTIHIDE